MPDYHHPSHRLDSPAAHRTYYDQRSRTYDDQFAAALGYVLPLRVAEVFRAHARAGDDPVADVGCGTGLLGRALVEAGPGASRPMALDGYDISAGMLGRAAATGCYRDLVRADLTAPLAVGRGAYGAVVSCGTFTVGHLGPADLPIVLALARPGALAVVSVNERHALDTGFGAAFDALAAEGRIGPVEVTRVCMYASPDTPQDPICWALVVAGRIA